MKKKICILGLGYIGLPTAAMFATHGHKIIGVDINKNVVEALNKGEIIIEEPYLDIMVQAAVTSGNLIAKNEPELADVFIIAVPTPINKDKTADLKAVTAATESIVPYLQKGNLVILESTSPPRTVVDIMLPILSKSGLVIGEDLFVAHSPERVLPGRILHELVDNNRIVGGINKESCEQVKQLYSTFVRGEIFLTDATTAEMCKLMENTFRDVNIALANELAKICEQMNINAWEVIKLANKHPRVNIHTPGPGVGGHCLAVDPWFIVEKMPNEASIIKLSRETNDSMPHHVLTKIKEILRDDKDEKHKVTILGMTYKPDVDDIRESPILELIELIEEEKNIEIALVDPHVETYKHKENDIFKAVQNSSLIVLAVNHQEFKDLNLSQFISLMKKPVLLDTRNALSKDMIEEIGFEYFLLGAN